VRNSVGGDVDPRTGKYWFTENARDWISDDLPSDKLNMINKGIMTQGRSKVTIPAIPSTKLG
jgi:glucose/arabinose dehydrogenase